IDSVLLLDGNAGDTQRMGRKRDGGLFPVDVARADWPEDNGLPGGGVIVKDASERRRAEEELRRSRAHLDEAQRVGGLGSWDWHIASGHIELSDAMCILLGIPIGTTRTPDLALTVIHPDDRDEWTDVMRRRIAGEDVPM